MKTLKITTLLFLLMSLASCFQDMCLEGYGPMVTEYYDTPDFHSVSYSGNGKVYLTQSETREVKIVAQKIILEQLKVEVYNGTLVILSKRCLDDPEIQVYISGPEYRSVDVNGSALLTGMNKITSDKFNISLNGSGNCTIEADADELSAVITGSGLITLSGDAPVTKYRILGSGKIGAFDLISGTTECNIDGSGTILTNTSDTLKACIIGSGTIIYKGSPEVTPKTVGSGKVVKAN